MIRTFLSHNRWLMLVIVILGFSFLGFRSTQGQGIRNLKNSQELFSFLQEHKVSPILTQKGVSQDGAALEIEHLRLSPKPQRGTLENDSLTSNGFNGVLHVVGSTIIDTIISYQNSRFTKGLFIGFNEGQRLEGSSSALQVKGKITIKELADPNRTEPVPVCTGPDGVMRLCSVVDNTQQTPFTCKEYKEIFANEAGIFDVPKRNEDAGTCFYTKLLDGVDGSTLIQKRVDENIVAADHDGLGNIKPKDLGHKKINIKLNDRRYLKLVGADKTDTSKLVVDNFFLIRMNNDKSVMAYGTRDASFREENKERSDYILYNDNKVELKSSIDGGTAAVDPIDITKDQQVGRVTDFTINALDCGAGQVLREVYLLFQ